MVVAFSLLNYLFMLLISLSLSNLIFLLLALELLSWSFSLLVSGKHQIKYLFVQSIFIFLSLYGALFAEILLMVGLFLKMGMPPFHLWFFFFMMFLKKWLFFFFSTFHKLIPLFVFIKVLMKKWSALFLTILIFLSVMTLEVVGMLMVLVLSSLIHSIWMMMSSFLSLSLIIFYWVAYLIILLILVHINYVSNMFMIDHYQNKLTSLTWLIFSGFPPFTMFWLKINVVSFFVEMLFLVGSILLFLSVFNLFLYYRVYHLSLGESKLAKEFSFIKLFFVFSCFWTWLSEV